MTDSSRKSSSLTEPANIAGEILNTAYTHRMFLANSIEQSTDALQEMRALVVLIDKQLARRLTR